MSRNKITSVRKNGVFSTNENCSLITSYEDEVKLMTKVELSHFLNISISFIDKLIAEEGLPRFKIGKSVRFTKNEVMEFLERRQRP